MTGFCIQSNIQLETRIQEDGKIIKALPTETYFSLVRKQLEESGQAYVRVTGISMQPLLCHLRDGVVIVPPEQIRRGDIVLFDRKNGRYALHRVIRKRKSGFDMAGDNQWFMEKDLPYDQIVGVVSCIERKGKRISRENFFLKAYGWTVTMLAQPRICIWRIFTGLGRKILRKDTGQKEGT